MEWLEKLDKFGYNFLVDELVWHLEQGRNVVSMARVQTPARTGVIIDFQDGTEAFHQVAPKQLDEHWKECKEITAKFSELSELRYVD